MPQSLIIFGGWDGHQPKPMSELFERILKEEGFDVTLSDSLDVLRTADLSAYDLLVPNWTMGKIADEPLNLVAEAVRNGLGVAGCHGGMCDAFREATEWQFITGGQWVSHPGNDQVRYTVRVTDRTHPIMRGIEDFEITSEQYYMHVDPANKVLATTRFPTFPGPHEPNGSVEMPVVWTRFYGKGRIFYSSIGHTPGNVAMEPHLTIMRRGLRWAARTRTS